MSLSEYESGMVYESWLESRVAAFEEALRVDPLASPEPFLAECPTDSTRARLARELALIISEHETGPLVGGTSTVSDPVAPPVEIGPFVLGKMLGQGGFGQVYEAWDGRLERPVALKLLRSGPRGGGHRGETFWIEARAVSRLRHPSIVVLYDVGEHEGRPYLVYERIEGTDLRTVLRSGPLPLAQAFRIVRKIGQALDHAHDRGILHRDVKPSNILIDQDGEPYLTDFGLASSTKRDQWGHSASICGTPCYMAPEQFEGEPATVATDVYGLSAVLYECLTGQPPFRGPASRIEGEVLGRMPDRPSAIRRGLNERIDSVVQKGLAKSPVDRYANVRELLASIGGGPVETDALGIARTPGWAGSRRRRAIASALAAALLVGVAFGLRDRVQPRGEAPDVARIMVEGSASMARGLTEQERDRVFRGGPDSAGIVGKADFRGFFRTLLAMGDSLPKAARCRILLESAGASRNRGDTAGAASDLIEAAALADSALAENEASAESIRIRLEIARAVAGSSDLPGFGPRRRLAEARQAVALGQRLAAPAVPGAIAATDMITLANLLRAQGETAEAAEVYARALATLRHLPEETGGPAQTLERLQVQYLLAQGLRGSGRRDEALAAYRMAGRTLAGMPERVRSSERMMDLEADRCFHEARLTREAGDPRAALPLCERAVSLWGDLAARTQRVGAGAFVLPRAHALNLGGAIRADLGEGSAVDRFDQAAALYRSVLGREPEAINARRGLANVLHASGRLRAEAGNWADAASRFGAAVRERQAIVALDRGTEADRVDLAASCQSLGEADLALGHRDAGRESLRTAIAMFSDLKVSRPHDISLRQRAAEAARMLASHDETPGAGR